MKVMMRKSAAGVLSAYVAKKDLEETVVAREDGPWGGTVTLANGWVLALPELDRAPGCRSPSKRGAWPAIDVEAPTLNPPAARELPGALREGLLAGTLAPYLGPAMLSLCEGPVLAPADPQTLAVLLATRSTVPGKLRKRLSAAAQFIENFKHRKTLVQGMDAAFGQRAQPSALHRWLPRCPRRWSCRLVRRRAARRAGGAHRLVRGAGAVAG